tara:strand:- start:136 stop:639 length:504 start_codon:yes stop_codon:yes gene_type:complete
MPKTYADKGDSYQSGVSNLGNGSIDDTKADGTVEEKSSQSKKEEKTHIEVAEQARQTNGKVKSIRENIADYLPDSALRRKMLSKAEKKRDRLDAKFGAKEYSASNNAIHKKDQDKFTNIAQTPKEVLEQGEREYGENIYNIRAKSRIKPSGLKKKKVDWDIKMESKK